MTITAADRDTIKLIVTETANATADKILTLLRAERQAAIETHERGCSHGRRLAVVVALASGIWLAIGALGGAAFARYAIPVLTSVK